MSFYFSIHNLFIFQLYFQVNIMYKLYQKYYISIHIYNGGKILLRLVFNIKKKFKF